MWNRSGGYGRPSPRLKWKAGFTVRVHLRPSHAGTPQDESRHERISRMTEPWTSVRRRLIPLL